MGRIAAPLLAVAAAVVVAGALAFGTCFPVAAAPVESPDAKVAPWLVDHLERRGADSFLVLFDRSPDLARLRAGVAGGAEPGRALYDALRRRARALQAATRRWLEEQRIDYRPLWVVNGLKVTGDLALARRLALRSEVVRIVGDPRVRGIDARSDGAAAGFAGLEWGLLAIGADQVWSHDGTQGEGVVVASADTGVEWNHPALIGHYRGWDGMTASHDYNWHDSVADLATPLDDHDHGTHTTGTMVGDDGGGNQIGVAPGARWIGCRNMNAGVGQPSTYLDCIQYFLAPWPHGGDPELDGDPARSPHIVNNSWSCPPSEGCDAGSLLDGFRALEAAGILAVTSAGNSGPFCGTVSAPPAIYAENLVVGATDAANNLSLFSSRGPVQVDGSGRLRPDLSAPGQGVRSSVRGSGYASFSGTSMASPHTAGAAALLWSARPELRGLIRITRCLLTRSSGPMNASFPPSCGGTTRNDRPNNHYGWGLLDAHAALHHGPDGDLDGIADECDCAPADGGAFEAPFEVAEVAAGPDRDTLSWASQGQRAGSGTTYDLLRGDLDALVLDGGVQGAACHASGVAAATHTDTERPLAGRGFYYLVRGVNACGAGGWGADGAGVPRTHPGCP